MSIRVALHHLTTYRYNRQVQIFPQTVRLRPAPHCRTPIASYSLNVQPDPHFLNWQQDPFGNYLARLVFPEKRSELTVEVDLVAEMTVVNPFDFFLDEHAEQWPFAYDAALAYELKPYLMTEPAGPKLQELADSISREKRRSVLFLIEVNRRVQEEVGYTIRLDPGVQTSEETLTLRRGSCRDSAWLLVELLRQLGLACAVRLGLFDSVCARREAARRSGRTDPGFLRLARLDRSLPARGRLGRPGPHLGTVGRRRASAVGRHAGLPERGPDQRRRLALRCAVRPSNVGRPGDGRTARHAPLQRRSLARHRSARSARRCRPGEFRGPVDHGGRAHVRFARRHGRGRMEHRGRRSRQAADGRRSAGPAAKSLRPGGIPALRPG